MRGRPGEELEQLQGRATIGALRLRRRASAFFLPQYDGGSRAVRQQKTLAPDFCECCHPLWTTEKPILVRTKFSPRAARRWPSAQQNTAHARVAGRQVHGSRAHK